VKSAARNIVVCLALLASVFPAFADSPLPEEAATLRFYQWYMKELIAGKAPLLDDARTLDTFISKGLHHQLTGLMKAGRYESDYFTGAQDFSDAWAQNIAVQRTDRLGDEATVVVDMVDVDFGVKLAVLLKHQGSGWKIFKVVNIKQRSPDGHAAN
jgi:hypothetical protein